MHSVDDEGSDNKELCKAVEKWNEQPDDEGEEETTASLLSSITSPRALHGRLSQAELALKEAKLEVEGLRTQLAECEGRLRSQDEAPAQVLQETCPADSEANTFSAARNENEQLRTHCKN